MPGKKYSFGQPSLMKAIEPGQTATLKFVNTPKLVETEWGQKYKVTIFLLSHPLYSIESSKGIKMDWQSSAKVLKDVTEALKEAQFMKDYYDMTWELTVAEDGSYWLNA